MSNLNLFACTISKFCAYIIDSISFDLGHIYIYIFLNTTFKEDILSCEGCYQPPMILKKNTNLQ